MMMVREIAQMEESRAADAARGSMGVGPGVVQRSFREIERDGLRATVAAASHDDAPLPPRAGGLSKRVG
jgi:hypothetical protein